MAQQRIARLTSAFEPGPDVRLLDFELVGGELGFRGGQYIIVNTGIELGGGKIAKRAYSLCSGDSEQRWFSIAVRRIGEGPGSNFMHRLAVGQSVPFSGPWGKFTWTESARSILVMATDTGITAALGLLGGREFSPCLGITRLVWFVESDGYFLRESFVRERLSRAIGDFEIATAPAINSGERLPAAIDLMNRIVARGVPESAFLAGDGAMTHALREQLVNAGIDGARVRMESFFNNPERKAPV